MRLHRRATEADKLRGIDRCFFNAEEGRTHLALMRLSDLHEEFPNDAQIIYAEGLIRKDHLGQGVASRELFERAYEADHTHAFAACNASKYARNEAEYRRWTSLALTLLPADDHSRPAIESLLSKLDSGIPYCDLLAGGASACLERGGVADAAALLELALLGGGMSNAEELEARRARAQSLRALDSTAHAQRHTLMEDFPPDERLALREALAELDKALGLDEFDPELWNLRSAWCSLLRESDDAVHCADRAIGLRPHGYPKPYHNKANALWDMHRDEEALACARESLEHANAAGASDEVERSHALIKAYARPRTTLVPADIEPIAAHKINAAGITCDREAGQWHRSKRNLIAGIRHHMLGAQSNRTMDYISLMAELLTDVTPETAFCAVAETARRSQETHAHCLQAALYVAAYSDPVLQRDTARFLVLTLFGAVEGHGVRSAYRKAILETSSAADNALSHLDGVLRDELRRISPVLPDVLADQEPVDEFGRDRARKMILSRFPANPEDIPPPPTIRPKGCAGSLVLLLAALLAAAGLIV